MAIQYRFQRIMFKATGLLGPRKGNAMVNSIIVITL